jgi:hypothetical protein
MPRNFPEPLAAVIQACWAQDAADRPSAMEVEARLLHLQQGDCLEAMAPKSLFSKLLKASRK